MQKQTFKGETFCIVVFKFSKIIPKVLRKAFEKNQKMA